MGLYDSLRRYVSRGIVPMHMPGHKRNPAFVMDNPYSIDITEVEGMDDLHHPTGEIRRLMNRFRDFYDTRDTYLCVNGSTSANMIAIASSTRRSDVIVIDANSHRSVTNSEELLGLKSVRVVRPDFDHVSQIPGPIRPSDVQEMFRHLTSAGRPPAAIVVTSPTYEGVVSDIRGIADVVHPYGAILIVDAAHGAHLRLAARTDGTKLDWPESPCALGADLVIESLHKTLPALTQTSVLHRCTERVSDDTVMKWHDVFITSSPSYVLMSSMDQCMEWQECEGTKRFKLYDDRLKKIYDAVDKVDEKRRGRKRRGIVLEPENRDPSKIVVCGDGAELEASLRSYGIEPERVEDTRLILMTSPADEAAHLERVAAWLMSL